ncbi:MAG: ABC transporter permease [Acidobacteriota bacterium]
MTRIFRDLRFGFRMLAKTPGHTLAAVLALALGIGLSTAMFSIVYGAILRGLPFERSDRLMHVENNNPSKQQRSLEVYLPDFLVYRERQKSFEGLAAFYEGTINLSGDERPERYEGAFISANFLGLLREKPLLGRGFQPGEDTPGAEPVVLLGWGAWQTRYNGDPKVIGKAVRINGEPGTIIGVMPRGFAFPLNQEIWVPLRTDPLKTPRGKDPTLEVFGRLRDGVSLEQARTEMQGITKAVAAEFPQTNEGRGAVVKPYTEEYVGEEPARLLYTMLGACLFVLLLACTNVASLMMARASKRTREIAIRSALGAARLRLIGQLLTESLALSLLGAVLGVLLAWAGVRGFNAAIVDTDPPFWIHIAIDPAALAFTLGAALLAAAVSGLVPAFQASRTDVNEVLKDEGRGSSSLRLGTFTRIVVILEMAISCVLLVGAGLMIQNVLKMGNRVEVETANLFTSRVALFAATYPEEPKRVRFFDDLLVRLREDPAAQAAAVSTYLPGSGTWESPFAMEGAVYPKPEDHPQAHIAWVSPGFFETLGAKVDQGRDFNRLDTKESLQVVIVNRSFARKHWPGQDPLGRRIRVVGDGASDTTVDETQPWRTVVGVVPDLGMVSLDDDEPESQGFYIPVSQDAPAFASMVVRTRDRNPLTFTDRARAHVSALDRDLPVYFVRSLEEVVARAGFFSKLFATLFSIFGVAALVLASVGIYGVIAFSVQQRTQEIGIRMALGAQQGSVLGMIVRQGLVQLAFGLGLGLLLAWPTAKLLGNILVGVTPHDPPTFVSVFLVLAAVALLACWVPAQRASRTDPLVAIRYD